MGIILQFHAGLSHCYLKTARLLIGFDRSLASNAVDVRFGLLDKTFKAIELN